MPQLGNSARKKITGKLQKVNCRTYFILLERLEKHW